MICCPLWRWECDCTNAAPCLLTVFNIERDRAWIERERREDDGVVRA